MAFAQDQAITVRIFGRRRIDLQNAPVSGDQDLDHGQGGAEVSRSAAVRHLHNLVTEIPRRRIQLRQWRSERDTGGRRVI
jgi:hypothetical protein